MSRRWTPWKIGVQIVGFAAGIGLFGWCLSVALRPDNKASIDRLLDAPAPVFVALLGCAALSLACNGTLFWLLMSPVRRIGWGGVTAVNAIATSLNYLPFKLSLLSRFVIHNRRDGLPITLILAWIGAAGVVILGAIAPPIVATVVGGRVDGAWWAMAVVGLGVSGSLVMFVARGLRGAGPGTLAARVLTLRFIKPMTPGLEMLADARAVWGTYLVRTADIALVAARFWLAAHACGTPITAGTALLAASTYFLIGMVTPSGALGAREGGATLLAGKVLHLPDVDMASFAVVALVASASELVVNLAAAAIGAAYLRFSPVKEGCVRRQPEG